MVMLLMLSYLLCLHLTEELSGLVRGEDKVPVSCETRKRAILDTQARNMIRELVFHAIYISVLLVVCYGNVDQSNFRQTDTLKKLFPNTSKVRWHGVSYNAFSFKSSPRGKMAAISQTISSDTFLWMKIFVFWYHWSLLLWVLLIINQHGFR